MNIYTLVMRTPYEKSLIRVKGAFKHQMLCHVVKLLGDLLWTMNIGICV